MPRPRRARRPALRRFNWIEIPRPKGSKAERKEINLDTGKTRRLRARTDRRRAVNKPLPVKCPPWIENECEKCAICGERSDQVSLGVTWLEGEELIRAQAGPGGGWRSRGPVLWAMHKIKLDRFAERHLDCRYFGTKKYGGPFRRELPPKLVWAVRFGTEEDQAIAVLNAQSAGIPDATLYQVVSEELALKADLIPF
jgi:hypothetical protein